MFQWDIDRAVSPYFCNDVVISFAALIHDLYRKECDMVITECHAISDTRCEDFEANFFS